MNQLSIWDSFDTGAISLLPYEQIASKLEALKERITSNRWLSVLIENQEIVAGDTYELSLKNGVNIDLSLVEDDTWTIQVFPDDPLAPKLTEEASARLSTSLATSLLRQGFIHSFPKHQVHRMPHYEATLHDRDIIKIIAHLWKIWQ